MTGSAERRPSYASEAGDRRPLNGFALLLGKIMTPRELFLRGVWALIPSDRQTAWVRRAAKAPATSGPLGDYGEVVRRMLAAGVSEQDIARFARIVGYETAFGLLSHLDDPSASFDGFGDDEPELYWGGLQAFDAETDAPVEPLSGLHESLLSADPSGREMRPAGGE